jgi:phospholipase C
MRDIEGRERMGPTSWNAVKLFLAAGTPIQKLVSVKGDTHLFCIKQALQILKNDGAKQYARNISNYIDLLNNGVLWADKGWKNFSHYFDPVVCQGFGPWPDARVEFDIFFNKALTHFKKGDKVKYYFYLGAALHLIQDLCVPHHAKGAAFSGHKEYEKWVLNNYNDYAVETGGIYRKFSNPGDWLLFNARFSRCYFPYVSDVSTDASYKLATSALLPLAQRSTAGFLKLAIDLANKTNK